jgi:hypothetical protein
MKRNCMKKSEDNIKTKKERGKNRKARIVRRN